MKLSVKNNFNGFFYLSRIYSLFLLLGIQNTVWANLINANASNYSGYLSTLSSGDTLLLAPGIYKNNLILNGRNGTASKPLVIMGSSNLYTTIFEAQACCNTISITKCSYVVIKNLQLDGLNLAVDAVKAEGSVGNWAHHITIEYLNILRYGINQQVVGISTKCSAWNWIIRKNRIVGAGTGMYLGNSDGSKPFVNGIIEYNYIANTLGYNIEIKHQFNGVRDSFPETMSNGKTMLRYNMFSKDQMAATGANARPNLLVGGFPTTGWGAQDYYEIYGNVFYNNPVEALFQGTGNIALYNNIFINHYDPTGYRGIYITPQNGVNPQDIKVFHNTVWTKNSAGALRLYSPNSAFKQYCYGNAVFSAQPITNFTDTFQNITDSYLNAGNHVLLATTTLNTANMYPLAAKLTGSVIPNTLFTKHTDYNKDFNNEGYNWSFRGAYAGCCTNTGWQLQTDTMPDFGSTSNGIFEKNTKHLNFDCFPNPFQDAITVRAPAHLKICIIDLTGRELYSATMKEEEEIIQTNTIMAGIYFLRVSADGIILYKEIIKR